MPSDNKDKNEESIQKNENGFFGKLKKLSKLNLQEVFKGNHLKKLFTSSSSPRKSANSLDVLEMDLIKDEVLIYFDWRERFSSMFLFLILAVVLVGESYYLLYIWKNEQMNVKSAYLKEEITSTQKEINDFKQISNEAFSFKSKLAAVSPVFKSHIYWSNFFDYLEKNTLQDVYYLSFKGNTSGNYVINSKVKDYRAINFQLKTMLSSANTLRAVIANEKIDNAAGPSVKPGASFDLELEVRPEIFFK